MSFQVIKLIRGNARHIRFGGRVCHHIHHIISIFILNCHSLILLAIGTRSTSQ
jgi:hypothetical protein